MRLKLRSALFAALAFGATTLFGGYLDTNTWSSDNDGVWNYDSANDRLTCVLKEDRSYSTCEISVPCRGWLTFGWRVVSAANESQVLKGYGWVDKVNSRCSVYAEEYGSSGWRTMRVPVRESAGGIASIEFCDWDDMNGKVQITNLVWEPSDEMPVTVSFSLRGGRFVNGEASKKVCTSTYEKLPTPVRDGCAFLGWTEELDGSSDSDYVEDGDDLPLSSAVTLYAHWDVPVEMALDPAGTLRDESGGNRLEVNTNISVSVGQSWYKRADPVEVVDFVIQETGEYDLVTLHVGGCGTLDFGGVAYSGWGGEGNEMKIALVIDGTTVAQTAYAGEHDSFSRRMSGRYDICEFPTDGDAHEVRVVATGTSAESYFYSRVEVGAFRWTEETATSKTVSFDSRGGSTVGSRQYAVGGEYGSLPTPTRANASFLGWWTKADGGERVQAADFVRPSVTNLYARWTTSSLSMATGGNLTVRSKDGSWIGSADVSRKNDGSWAAATDGIRYGATNVMSTTVSGRGIVSFWWMSGLQDYYYRDGRDVQLLSSLTLWVDGAQVAAIDGHWSGSGWRHLSYAIDKTGSHVIEWRYVQEGDSGAEWDAELIADIVAEANEWRTGGSGAALIHGPGAWVQDVSWAPAGEIDDFVTWARGAAEGRSWLTDELPAIEAYYTKKIKRDSRDYESVLLRALTKVAQLGENADLLAVLKKFGYVPDYQNLCMFFGELDYGQAPLSNDVVDTVVKKAEPVLESALADLESIPDSWTGSIALSPDVYPVDETTFVDLADVTFARAAVKGALASLAVAQSYDLSLVYAKVESRIKGYNSDAKTRPTFEQIVNDHPDFMKSVRSKSRLAEGKTLLRAALETAQTADKRMLARTSDELHFFEYDQLDEDRIQFAREEVAKGLKSLGSTVVLTDDDFVYFKDYRLENLNQSVALSPFFAGKLTRAYLGAEFDENGRPVLESFPDVMFGGILPGLTKSTVASWFASYGIDVGVVTDSVTPDPEVPDSADGRLCDDVGGVADLSSAQVYQGCLYDEDGNIAGSIQVKTAKAKADRKTGKTTSKVTAAIQVAGEAKRVTASGILDVDAGYVSLKAKDGRVLEIKIGADGFVGTFDGKDIDGVRNLFSSKDQAESKSANGIANALKAKGAIAVVWEDEETGGLGMVSVVVGAKGKAKVSGTMPNGTKVSVSTQLVVGEETCCIPVAYSKRGVNLSFGVWLSRDGEDLEVSGLGDGVEVGWASALNDGATFSLDVDGLAELLDDDTYADYFPDGLSVSQNGAKLVVANGAKAGKVVLDRKTGEVDESRLGENPSGLKLTYKAKNGTFKGAFKAYANVKDRPKATTVSVTGLVVDGVGYGVATVKKRGSVSVRVE